MMETRRGMLSVKVTIYYESQLLDMSTLIAGTDLNQSWH